MPKVQKKILTLEPFYGESHKTFLDSLTSYSKHDFTVFTQPGSYWKWRVNSSPYAFAELLKNDLSSYDTLFLSDYVDLPSFLGLTGGRFSKSSKIVYFHENQITYPVKEGTEKDYHYGFLNLASAAIADQIWFNSQWHQNDFFEGAESFLRKLPKPKIFNLDKIEKNSKVVYLGVDTPKLEPQPKDGPLIILWNHRWEFDKGPDDFFKVIQRLSQKNLDFKITVCGKSYNKSPEIFSEIKKLIPNKIEHMGWVENRSKYFELIQKCDVVVSTAIHDFFGMSVVEAMGLGCFPLLPNRLSYPELIPASNHDQSIFSDLEDLENKLEKLIEDPQSIRGENLIKQMEKFKWDQRILEFDQLFS